MHILSLKGRCLSSWSLKGEKGLIQGTFNCSHRDTGERERKREIHEGKPRAKSLSLLSKSSLTPEFTHPSVSVREKDAWREVEFAVPGKSYGIDDRMTTEDLDFSFAGQPTKYLFLTSHTTMMMKTELSSDDENESKSWRQFFSFVRSRRCRPK